jgi:hypothetical protein
VGDERPGIFLSFLRGVRWLAPRGAVRLLVISLVVAYVVLCLSVRVLTTSFYGPRCGPTPSYTGPREETPDDHAWLPWRECTGGYDQFVGDPVIRAPWENDPETAREVVIVTAGAFVLSVAPGLVRRGWWREPRRPPPPPGALPF